MIQLNLFESIVEKNAYSLLDLLNEGIKDKEKYYPRHIKYYGNYRMVVAFTEEGNSIGNIIYKDGTIPDGFCTNWRSVDIIRNELKYLK